MKLALPFAIVARRFNIFEFVTRYIRMHLQSHGRLARFRLSRPHKAVATERPRCLYPSLPSMLSPQCPQHHQGSIFLPYNHLEKVSGESIEGGVRRDFIRRSKQVVILETECSCQLLNPNIARNAFNIVSITSGIDFTLTIILWKV